MQEAVKRVQRMELYLDTLQKAAETEPLWVYEDPYLQGMRLALTEYYENGQWLEDYRLDEQGEFPPALKRGVLSQDAVYDFLSSLPK